VIGLACGLSLLAVFCARQWMRVVRLERARQRIGGEAPLSSGPSPRRSVPSWAPWVAAGAAGGWVLWTPWGAFAGAAAGLVVRRLRAARVALNERVARDAQLADAVASIAAAVRAGLSMARALAYAAGETPPPLDVSLRALVREIDLGVPVEEAVNGWAAGLDTGDARLLAGVLRLHRRSGGDLPAVLDQVGGALQDRRDAATEVRSLTAQARLSGAILGLLPVAFFVFLWLTSRADIEGALHTTAGVAAVVLGLFMDALAFLWIRSLLEVA
jgi:tight adherence protein B